MNSSWVKSLLVITPLSAVLTLSGCGSSFTLPPGSPSPGSPSPGSGSSEDGSVAIVPAAASILPGQSQQFVAQVSGLSDKTVTWQVVSGGGTITSNGLYTAPSTTGIYKVIATPSENMYDANAAVNIGDCKAIPIHPYGQPCA